MAGWVQGFISYFIGALLVTIAAIAVIALVFVTFGAAVPFLTLAIAGAITITAAAVTGAIAGHQKGGMDFLEGLRGGAIMAAIDWALTIGTFGAYRLFQPLKAVLGPTVSKLFAPIAKAAQWVKNSRVGQAVSNVAQKVSTGVSNAATRIANSRVGQTVSNAASKVTNSRPVQAINTRIVQPISNRLAKEDQVIANIGRRNSAPAPRPTSATVDGLTLEATKIADRLGQPLTPRLLDQPMSSQMAATLGTYFRRSGQQPGSLSRSSSIDSFHSAKTSQSVDSFHTARNSFDAPPPSTRDIGVQANPPQPKPTIPEPPVTDGKWAIHNPKDTAKWMRDQSDWLVSSKDSKAIKLFAPFAPYVIAGIVQAKEGKSDWATAFLSSFTIGKLLSIAFMSSRKVPLIGAVTAIAAPTAQIGTFRGIAEPTTPISQPPDAPPAPPPASTPETNPTPAPAPAPAPPPPPATPESNLEQARQQVAEQERQQIEQARRQWEEQQGIVRQPPQTSEPQA
ncbi:hypothetical protein HC891_02800 [Candidatus Gracilibacteria bacterium]|nr:hypothetical protein [Candidatus Gracilibacteria bacterium]